MNKLKFKKEQTEVVLIQLRILGHMLNKLGMSKADVNSIIKGTYNGDEESGPSIKDKYATQQWFAKTRIKQIISVHSLYVY